ncbi:probable inactive tRNA-specific adenosine deaminase-like protein 3 isoform X1 [Periophthalmus magnuspinnatus]|uniref:probable inactive tRNA-specific adenosine deaminase-like protein 3 isoform X1 n=2 Tax=Periophthalmus magnuspinnatus TaxID=409849 RepID=UPI0024374163|nr:probable inactive tRNA-specific adenosine deaminase-like protein 3 isoform X1 [Periophthalmus magnuspinnatus]
MCQKSSRTSSCWDESEGGVGTMEPERKRLKISDCDVDSWEVVPVLSDELSQDVELVDAFAAPILDKKQTSKLVQQLNTLHPLTSLAHLKRVRPCKNKDSPHALEILICSVNDADEPCHFDCSNAGLGEPFAVKIPRTPPLTRRQFEQASEHWPTCFHEVKQVTAALRGELFNAKQKAKMRDYMMLAIDSAKAGKDLGMSAVGAVVVDPSSDKVIAVGHDCSKDHPLQHAVMVCIDLVAKSQGGGCYTYEKYPGCKFNSPDLENKTPQPYICTGYDLYVTKEPCVLCAMALVHSRIGRVFFGIRSEDGAMGTKFKIHTRKDLNHRFEVFKGVLARVCKELETDERDGKPAEGIPVVI